MRFVFVTGLFVAINLVAACVVWVLGKLTLLVFPDAGEYVWPFVLIGLAALAAAILGTKWGLALTARWLARWQARARV